MYSAAAIQESLTSFTLNIFVVSKAKDGGNKKRARIAIEGAEVLFGISIVALACTYLIGLIYVIKLSYPNKKNLNIPSSYSRRSSWSWRMLTKKCPTKPMISRSACWPKSHADIVEGRRFEECPSGKV